MGVLLLVIQIPLLILLSIDGELTIPRGWVEKAVNHHLQGEFSASFESISLDESGTVRIRDAVFYDQVGRKMASAEFIKADFYLPSVVFGIFHAEQIKVRNIDLFDTRGPLGIDDHIAHIPGANLIREDHLWNVDDAKLTIDNLAISASGRFQLPKLSDKGDKTNEHWEQFLDKIDVLRSQLQLVKHPFLKIALSSKQVNTSTAEVTFIAERAELPFQITLEDQLRISTSATMSGEVLKPGPIKVRAGKIRKEDFVSIENLQIRAAPPGGYSATAMAAGAKLNFSARSVTTTEGQLESPTLKLAVRPSFTAQANGQFSLFGLPTGILAQANLLHRTATVRTAGEIPAADILNHPLIPDDISKYKIRVDEPIFLRSQSNFQRGELLPSEVSFQVETEGFDIEGLSGVFTRAAGILYPKDLRVDVYHLALENKNYNITGSYSHDFKSNDFRFFIKGGFMPMDIAGFMRSWWDEVWAEFSIREVPYIDMELWGNWNHFDLRQMFAGVRFQNVSIKGMDIDRGYARMRTAPYFFETFDLHAYRPEGAATGSFSILQDWDTRETYAKSYDVFSTLNFRELAPLFGEELEGPLSEFELSSPPDLRIEGFLYPKIPGKESPQNHLSITASTPDPLVYKGIQLEHMKLTAIYKGETLILSPILFGIGGGTGSGRFTLYPENEERGQCSFLLSLENALPHKVVAAVPQLQESLEERMSEDQSDDLSKNSLNFFIEAFGDLDTPETLLGEGSIDLLTPNLANVRLLGILSRISEELPLPITLGSFQFERAKTSFLLNRGLIEIPDLTLYSPSSRLQAEGAYKMKDKTIDFNARVQLMREVKFPILAQIGMLLNPVGKVFEFRLWGELDDLNWRLYLDPRSW